MRLFICGITSDETEKISDLILKTKDYVDGYVWCVDSNPNSDETYQLLENNKKEGKIVRHPWVNAHDWQANEWLYSGIFKDGDYLWILDSSEIPTEFWLQRVKNDILQFEKQGIVALFASGRAYLAKWAEYLFFEKTPHWQLSGINGNITQLTDEQKKLFIINKRDLNLAKHYQEHDTKYYLYGRSNQIEAFYSKYGQNIVNFHEQNRREFRKYLKKETGMEASLKALDMLFKKLKEEFSEYEISMLELEFCLSEYYRRTVLGEDFLRDIVPRRERWSFQNFISTGDGFSDENYLGTRLRYDKLSS